MSDSIRKSIEKQNRLLEEILQKGSLESVLRDVSPIRLSCGKDNVVNIIDRLLIIAKEKSKDNPPFSRRIVSQLATKLAFVV